MYRVPFILSTVVKYEIRYLLNRYLVKRSIRFSSQNVGATGTQSSSMKNYDQPDDSEEILDIYRERLKYSPLLEDQELEEENKFGNLNLNRGVSGVFDIEDLVETLEHQQAQDIFVASVPKEIKYVDYIVIVSGKSQRHMKAIAQFIRRVYKQKRHSTDLMPKLEGENSPDWLAIDLGNIALHVFSQKARLTYDLDSLWAVGSKYDEEYNKEEPVSSFIESHSFSLRGLEPAES